MSFHEADRRGGEAAMIDERSAEPRKGTSKLPIATPPPQPYDAVDDCGEASFPSSDPPSWWSGR